MSNERDNPDGIEPEDATVPSEQLELMDEAVEGEPEDSENESPEEALDTDPDEDNEEDDEDDEDDEEDDEDEDDEEDDEDDDDEEDEEDEDELLAEGRAYFITALPSPWVGSDNEGDDDEQVVVGIERPLEEVKAEFDRVFAQAALLARSAAKRTPGGLEIDEITFTLGFDAGGRIGFVAGTGASGSIEISFAPSEED